MTPTQPAKSAKPTPKPKRRLGAENAENRIRLIEAAERLMIEEGYVAVTARKVAAKAGLKMQLVYYYFENMDELILAVARQNSAKRMKRFVRALASPEPLNALWEMHRETTSGTTAIELQALANHRDNIQSEIVAIAREFRALQVEAVERLLTERGINREKIPPAAIVVIITALTRTMAQDRATGVWEGYEEAINLVERGLAWLVGKEGQAQDNLLTTK